LFTETRSKIETKPANNVWEVGYWSTDDDEDNDSDYDCNAENEEEYDEEDYGSEEDEEEEKNDPTEIIKQEKFEK
jgi:hypothetical protein